MIQFEFQWNEESMEEGNMREQYDCANAIKNSYINKLKKQIIIRLDLDITKYFKDLSDETGIKYQQLINLYVAECAKKHLKSNIEWSN
jgi:uncharacterized protein (DUF4415 family)